MPHRTPLGLIVEGFGEAIALERTIRRGVRGPYHRLPIVRASGFGDVIANLSEHVIDLVISDSPRVIIVAIDAKDPVSCGTFGDCYAVKRALSVEAQRVLSQLSTNTDLAHPVRIDVVLPVPTFD